MNCPNCQAECVLHTHKGFSGYACPNCHAAGTLAELAAKPATQMSMYEDMGEKFFGQFLTDTKGNVVIEYVFNDCKRNPKREMRCGYFDRQKKIPVVHATFSCS